MTRKFQIIRKKKTKKSKHKAYKDVLMNHLESIGNSTIDCISYLKKENPNIDDFSDEEIYRYNEKLDKLESDVWELRNISTIFW